ncbi:hypothetical protein [Kribbella jiaozuonensis]|uniref:Uncharacterized protein n=1 Tax=Kribbella jiaozuonensis TaxID=2575441 RepID=A0A4U3LKV8_9ACTN|nr:hypothetical protein [Kribbella jiaozuonensis]TKK76112.1 hypothetical protein FDA38_27220 [Kribbella jiaozuonensis]
MKRLLRLYPASWRREYGDELAQLLEDLGPLSLHRRIGVMVDLVRGATDAHFRALPAVGAVLRRAVLVASIVWAALSIEIVLSNVVFPTGDNDGASVLISYLAVFVALTAVGVLTGRLAGHWRIVALAGGCAGALVGVLTIGTYAVIDNLFLDVISRQQPKIDGLASSGFTSMRTYINLSLLLAGALLSTFLGFAGAGLAVLGSHLRRAGSRRQILA